jgi:mono/diheme cytochrome c family protein
MKRLIALLACAAALSACGGPKSGLGFRLPDGDAQRGRDAFLVLRCHACHQVEGLDLPSTASGPASVTLGGKIVKVKTYGELVTSIINPSHRIAPLHAADVVSANASLMTLAYLNDVMTVQQLIDLVAFLQASYQVMPPQVSPYDYLYP